MLVYIVYFVDGHPEVIVNMVTQMNSCLLTYIYSSLAPTYVIYETFSLEATEMI